MAIQDRTFFRQFSALFVKNWIVLSRNPNVNLLACFIAPVLTGAFLALAQLFLNRPHNFGIGEPVPVARFSDVYDHNLAFIWADGTNGAGIPAPTDIMSRVTSGFNERQLQSVRQVASPDDIPNACPQNFNLLSECFAAVSFNSLPTAENASIPLNYTIHVDGGLSHIDVVRHTSDFEKRILPLQWAIDSAIIELTTGVQTTTPLQWPFTVETNDEQYTRIRLRYVDGLRDLLVLALFACYISIAYQLPGAYMGERSNLLTSHLQAMGLRNTPRIISWHLSYSTAYLPAWVIVSIIWHFRIFTGTNAGLVLVVHVLCGLSLASWSLFVATPFEKSPQLAAVSAMFLSLLFAILAQAYGGATTGMAFIFSILFPPGFYVFAIRCIAGFELNHIPTNALHRDPDNQLVLLHLIIAAIIATLLWPYLAVQLEKSLYDTKDPSTLSWWERVLRRKRKSAIDESLPPPPPNTAVSIRHLRKAFDTSPWWSFKKTEVEAIADLTLDIPKLGIFVLLGSNGAGKSTALSILAGLLAKTSGSVTFENGTSRLGHGELGIVPQKNVLFPELSCYQTVKLWRAIKTPSAKPLDKEDIIQLLKDCDLGHKIHAMASTLSGGQKRKLQLAIGLVGGSKVVLVDECTSGVDPLSRRALWKTLTSVRNERTVVFTTHFLDEADLLADNIAVLAAPGKLVAEGSPVSLKSSLGKGYTVSVTAASNELSEKGPEVFGSSQVVLQRIQSVAPAASLTSSTVTHTWYSLNAKDVQTVEKVLDLLEREQTSLGISSFDVHGTSLEDIFLLLMKQHGQGLEDQKPQAPPGEVSSERKSGADIPRVLQLTTGRRRRPISQALTIFHKRWLIAKRSWLTPALAVIIAVSGSCIPLFFVEDRSETCTRTFDFTSAESLYLPDTILQLAAGFLQNETSPAVLTSPPGLLDTLGSSAGRVQRTDVQDNQTFVQTITQNHRNFSVGGLSMDLSTGQSLVAWQATPPGFTGPVLLNLADTILFNRALNSTPGGAPANAPVILNANYQQFPGLSGAALSALRWTVFFGLAMSTFPAFFALYVAHERRSSVQAMQLSNGLADPVGLWLGHLLFDTVFVVLLSTIIIIIFAAVAGSRFFGLGFFWLVLVLYGITGALFSYCVSLITASPLSAFAAVAGYQVILFMLYLSGYLLTLTYAKTSNAGDIITIIHFTLSLIIPVASPLRASFVSVNLFSLLCNGGEEITTNSLGSITKYGGPIAYLFIFPFILFAVLVWFDSGSNLPAKILSRRRKHKAAADSTETPMMDTDVDAETDAVSSSNDPLRVMHISKTFRGSQAKAVDDVTFGVSQNTILALLGPNGAGKTTTFNMIRGDIFPDSGDVLIQGTSVIRHPRTARLSLGVCPQFTAIDTQLTVREHLAVYGRLKGLYRGRELDENVEILLEATALLPYADRLANKLSGGNQRKLSLAIALIGNPSVVLIDEFSTGIDAKMKRDMWATLKSVAIGKAVVITTHSMEEASALANKVGIIARRMLAVGSTDSLASRYPIYEVHFSCHTQEERLNAQQLMARIPGSRMADDVATRFEVPMSGDRNHSLVELFKLLAAHGNFADYTVERVSLESVFLKVIRQNNVEEEDSGTSNRKWWRTC